MRNPRSILLLVVLPLMVLCAVGYALPPIRSRVDYRLDTLRTQIKYALFPPEKAVFVPQDQVAAAVQATFAAMTEVYAAPTLTATPPPTAGPTRPPLPTDTPTPAPTPLPSAVSLKGVKYIDQHGKFNYCAPANLAMALTYWGWEGTRDDTGQVLKPFERDLNVMPYEMVDYVTTQTQLQAVWRPGGSLELLKKLLAAGFPVIVEKGAYMQDLSGKVSWMGHYQVVTGYDDAKQQITTQDSFYTANYMVTYEDLKSGWRSFNNTYVVVYSPDREAEVQALLGEAWDEPTADRMALDTATAETETLSGIDQYFAWYNRGSNLVRLQDFAGAATAYDQAFSLYETLETGQRPWRMLWYQTGPYFAYYYSGRYQDVVDLATLTIQTATNPYLEESFYWRGMALVVIGKQAEAIDDFHKALEYHPGFEPAVSQLAAMGVE